MTPNRSAMTPNHCPTKTISALASEKWKQPEMMGVAVEQESGSQVELGVLEEQPPSKDLAGVVAMSDLSVAQQPPTGSSVAADCQVRRRPR